jgi:predicted hydrolase (HD superfamily)
MTTTTPLDFAAARRLLHEWVASPALRAHMECVSACMRSYARLVEPTEEERWAICGLLHDLDWERHPTKEEHPRIAVAHLRAIGVDEEILDAIMGHAPYTGTQRVSAMSRHLFACDELAGFIVACAKVRPDGLATLEASSVRKKLKNLAFAANVSREDIFEGAFGIGADFDAHCMRCIEAVRTIQ